MTINPDYGFAGDVNGYLDFFIDGDANMGIELTRDGNKLQSHGQRFEEGGTYAPLELASWAVVDFCIGSAHSPASMCLQVSRNPSCLFVCFSADFARATFLQKGRIPEEIVLHLRAPMLPRGAVAPAQGGVREDIEPEVPVSAPGELSGVGVSTDISINTCRHMLVGECWLQRLVAGRRGQLPLTGVRQLSKPMQPFEVKYWPG